MADQMTPAEMRETAKRLRARVFVMERLGETADDERAGADALDNLADVIEYAERERARIHRVPAASMYAQGELDALTELACLARGETS